MILEQLKQNSKDFQNYILTKRVYRSRGVDIQEWTNNFELNSNYNDILFINYHDDSYLYELNNFTSLEQLKDRVVGYFSLKKKYTDDQYLRFKDLFQIVHHSVLMDFNGKKFDVILIAASVKELYEQLRSSFVSEEVTGVKFEEIKQLDPNLTEPISPGFVGQPAEGFLFELTSGSIHTEYPERIVPIKTGTKIIEPQANKNPYKTVDDNMLDLNFLVSDKNKQLIIDSFQSKLKSEKDACFESLYKVSDSYKEVYENIINKLDFNILGSLVFSQINAFVQGDTDEIICSTEKLKELIICPVLTDPWNLPKLNKFEKISIPSINFPKLSINFDFFEFIRKLIEETIIAFILRLISEILNYIFDILDCNDINRFIIKCKSTIDLRANSYLNNFNAESIFSLPLENTYIKIQNNLNQFNININLQEYLTVVNKIFASFTVSQLESLSNGIFSGQLFALIKNLIKSILGDKVEESKYINIINILNETVESDSLSENSEIKFDSCIHFDPYRYMSERFLEQGFTQEEIEQKIEEDKEKKKDTLKTVCSLLRNDFSNFNSEQFLDKNSDIIKYTLEKSIDTVFDSIGDNRYIQSVLKNQLLNTYGEFNIAAYYLFKNDYFNSSANAEDLDKFEYELGKGYTNNYFNLFDTPIFKNKYEPFLIKERQKLSFFKENNKIKFGENIINKFYYEDSEQESYIKDFDNKIYITNIETGFENNNSFKEFFKTKVQLLNNESLNTITERINEDGLQIYNNIYETTKINIYDNILSTYFVPELITNNSVQDTDKNKITFLDYLQTNKSKIEAKQVLL